MLKPFSQACENNAPSILVQLTRLLSGSTSVLEIGSGTGQHAVFFGKALPHLEWQASDLIENHEGICLWLDEADVQNVLSPIEFDVGEAHDEDDEHYDVIFMSNTLHILSWKQVKLCFSEVRNAINDKGLLVVYGPFNYNGKFTSESNVRFDQWLKAANSERGIRDFERVNKLAKDNGFIFEEDNAMPANNRLLVWRFTGLKI
ncbi:MAG: cyclopropane fatty-acyl-phospholipid synthase-like methyltransferase [Cellvibrionaceae bacterium]|jgi:cyclopropane fatty-acyl-phospholipid synthase-like methyltransferase